MVQQEVELLESQLRESPFIRILGNYPEHKVHEDLESDYDNGNGNGHSSSNGNGNGNGYSSSNGNGNGHSEHNGENGYEEHFDPQYLNPQYTGYPPQPQSVHHQPQKGYQPYQEPQHQMAQPGHKADYYGQQQPDYGTHPAQGANLQKAAHHGAGGIGFGQYENPQMGGNVQQPEIYEKPGQPFKGQQGVQPYNIQQGIHHPQGQSPQPHSAQQQPGYPQHQAVHQNYPPGYQQPGVPQHHQPAQNQPAHPKKMQPVYEGQTLNPPIHQLPQTRPAPGNQPLPKEKPVEDFRQPGYRTGAGKEYQGQPGFQQPQRPGYTPGPEPQQYHSKGAKANINTPPSQYYGGKGKPEYYKGGYAKPDVTGSRGGQQQGYYDAYGNYDPYYAGAYYDAPAKSQDLSATSKSFAEQQAYPGYDKPKPDRKAKQPAATEPTIKKPAKLAANPQPLRDGNPSKKPQTYEEMSDRTPKSFNRDDKGIIMTEDIGIGQTTTSWLQGAASPNEKFIDDTVENINRKPGFNRNKKFDSSRPILLLQVGEVP